MGKTILPTCGATRPHDGVSVRCTTFTDGVHRCCLGVTDEAHGHPGRPHECVCRAGWADLDLTAKATVLEIATTVVRPGDVLVVDLDTDALSDRARALLEGHIEDRVGNGARAVVLERGRVVGVLRTEESWREEIGESARCGKEWAIQADDVPAFPRHPVHACRLLRIHPDVGLPGCQCKCGMWAPFPMPVFDVEDLDALHDWHGRRRAAGADSGEVMPVANAVWLMAGGYGAGAPWFVVRSRIGVATTAMAQASREGVTACTVEEAADLYKRGNMHIVTEGGEGGSGDGTG